MVYEMDDEYRIWGVRWTQEMVKEAISAMEAYANFDEPALAYIALGIRSKLINIYTQLGILDYVNKHTERRTEMDQKRVEEERKEWEHAVSDWLAKQDRRTIEQITMRLIRTLGVVETTVEVRNEREDGVRGTEQIVRHGNS